MNFFSTSLNSPVNKNVTTNDRCADCYQKFNQQTILASTQCNHNFHTKCINDRKIEHCPLCKVATAGGMHQLDIISLTEEQANNSTINKLLVNRNFSAIHNMLDRAGYGIDIDFCESVLLEDILQHDVKNIANMLELLSKYTKSSYNQSMKVRDILVTILKNNTNKDDIIDIFITNFPVGVSFKQIALNYYIEQRNFTKAKNFLTQDNIRLPEDTVEQILLEDIEKNQLENIQTMLKLISIVKRDYNSKSNVIDNVLDRITTNFDKIEIVKIFREHGFSTLTSQSLLLEYNIEKGNFNNAENIIKQYKIDIDHDVFFNTLAIEIDQGNITNINRLFYLVKLSKQIDHPKFKTSLNTLLDNIILSLNKLNIIVTFLNYQIITPQAMHFICSNYYRFREECPQIKDLMKQHEIKFTCYTFSSELQKAINANNQVAIKEILELSKQNYKDKVSCYTSVKDILTKIVLDDNNLEIVEILLDFNRSDEAAINTVTEYYLNKMNFVKVKYMLNSYSASFKLTVFETIMKEAISSNNIVNIKQILNLVPLMPYNNHSEIYKIINNILENIVQYPDKIEVLDTILKEGMRHYYNLKPLVNYYLEQRNFIRVEHMMKYKKDISGDVFFNVLFNEIQENNIENIKFMLYLLKQIDARIDAVKTINETLPLALKEIDNLEINEAIGKYLSSCNI
jgi:hypothetical protein